MGMSPRRIGIVGAGFTGTMLAVHLLELSPEPIHVCLFDRAGSFARGTAYTANNEKHVLNVPAANMSAYETDPRHFIRWLCRNKPDASMRPSAHDFITRGIYGSYLQDVLEAACLASPQSVVERTTAEVIGLDQERDEITLTLFNGRRISFESVVLCVGNLPSAPPLPPDMINACLPRYVANPWNTESLSSIGSHDSVVLVGTGLTMIDVVLELSARGHQGHLTALSRRGLLPLPHAPARPWSRFVCRDNLPNTVARLLRVVREDVRTAAQCGFDWRSVVDALRPQAPTLWRNLPCEERSRFLRHVRPYWDVHRHRIAPHIARDIETLRREGRLTVLAGRIQNIDAREDYLRLGVRHRCNGALHHIEATWIINCSGSEHDYSRVQDPLIRSLYTSGLARPATLSLGLDVTDSYQLVDATGAESSVLYALGPPVRSVSWETTAVPDIRRQCLALARHLALTPAYDQLSTASPRFGLSHGCRGAAS